MRAVEQIRMVKKWWGTWGTVPVWSWLRAASHFRAGRYDAAQYYYRRGLGRHAEHPASYCARLDLAFCLFRTGQLEEAEKLLRHVTIHLPALREAHLRLAKLQLWRGHALEAAWTVRRALRHIKPDADLASIFLGSVLDNGGPWYLVEEAAEICEDLWARKIQDTQLAGALARLAMARGDAETGRAELERLVRTDHPPLDVFISLAEALLGDGRIAHARRVLRRALSLYSEYPRILSLLAESYLRSGPFYNSEYGKQLATMACQRTTWSSPREMHILAEAYYHSGDKISALVIASKAKEEGSRLLGTYRDVKSLERLIEDLSSGTQA